MGCMARTGTEPFRAGDSSSLGQENARAALNKHGGQTYACQRRRGAHALSFVPCQVEPYAVSLSRKANRPTLQRKLITTQA